MLAADVVYRKMLHGTPGGFFGASVDFNRFNAIDGPVIPRCATTALANDPTAQCSSGPINFWWPGAEATYKALLVKLDKRLSNRYQYTVSYALQSSKSILDVTQNLNDYFATYGPDLPRHNLSVSGMVELPWKVQLSVLSTFLSHLPVAPTIGGVDNTGTNVPAPAYTPLLGVLGKGYSDFLSKDDLQTLVGDYNATYAGTLTPAGESRVLRESGVSQDYAADRLRARGPFLVAGRQGDEGDQADRPDRTSSDRGSVQHFQRLEPDEFQLQPGGPGDVREGEPARRADVRIRRSAGISSGRAAEFLTEIVGDGLKTVPY